MAGGMETLKLIPGLDIEKTPTLNEFGISSIALGRFREGLFQKIGGWQKYYPFQVAGVPRALHAWEDVNSASHLGIGTTTMLGSITSGTLTTITPQTVTSDFNEDFSTVISTAIVTIVDPNISNVTVLDSIYLATPIAVGGLILSGSYQIQSIVGTHSYTITADANATSTVNNGGSVPTFTTTSGSATVTVNLTAHGVAANDKVVFDVSTTGNGVTISGTYTVVSITSANAFTITAPTQATSASTFSMNGGSAEIVYYINLGPPALGAGYGLGGYGDGGYGTGVSTTSQTGAPISADDWTLDNWGDLFIACPRGGGIYYWDPSGGFDNAALIATANAPLFNDGMFVSTKFQIIVAWGSTVTAGIGIYQDPMLVRWCDIEDFFTWTVTSGTQAGSYRLSNGSMIVGGLATSTRNLIWTDLALWAMSYVGPPDVFGFNQVGSKCGLIGSHAMTEFRGVVYWMGKTNFFRLDGDGVAVIPCPVWDSVFQDLDTANQSKVRIMPNTGPDEVGWLFPSASGGTGENDRYAKFNVNDKLWDIGPQGSSTAFARSAWIDNSVLGNPIAATPGGLIYQHETTNDADGTPINYMMETGWFMLHEGNEMARVDMMIPDFKWGFYNGSQNATIVMTLYAVDWPGDDSAKQRTYGPFSVTQTSQFFNPHLRGRQAKFRIEGNDIGSFSRMGNVRYMWQPDGDR